MAVHLCLNASKSDTDRYSSPIPLIGLYIAGATLVCLLFMLYDILSGFRNRLKCRYLPCRLFSLNSVTLTLLATALKLPVDLTTNMPGAKDQLSKLTGTTMLCICIGFLMPSVGIYKESESIMNMIALSILAVTVTVNVCIQMKTGVIFSFKVEHIMILCCMFILLLVLWQATLRISPIKTLDMLVHKLMFKFDNKSLVHGAKRWYICSHVCNPQLQLCRHSICSTVGVICIICSMILSQAAFRSLVINKLEFRKGVSDYEWSIWIVVMIQILAVIVGSSATTFRWLSLILYVKPSNQFISHDWEWEDFVIQFFFMKVKSIKMLIMTLSRASIKKGLEVIYISIYFIISRVPTTIFAALSRAIKRLCDKHLCKTQDDISTLTSWITDLEGNSIGVVKNVPEWIIEICTKDMNKWMDANKRDSPSYTVQLLLRRGPSEEAPEQLRIGYFASQEPSCLSLVVLVKIAAIIIPSTYTAPLIQALDEAFEIIYHIDQNINTVSSVDQRKRELAKLLATSGDIHLREKDLKHDWSGSVVTNALSTMDTAIHIFSPPSGMAYHEMHAIGKMIKSKECISIEELCNHIEQLFVDMLYFSLPQLPLTIVKEFNERPIEDWEERSKLFIKFLSIVEPLEDRVKWSFPKDTKIDRFGDSADATNQDVPTTDDAVDV